MARLHRGKGCPFCGKTTPHTANVRRTSPAGNTIRQAECKSKGGQWSTWMADGFENDKPSNAPSIRGMIALGWVGRESAA